MNEGSGFTLNDDLDGMGPIYFGNFLFQKYKGLISCIGESTDVNEVPDVDAYPVWAEVKSYF